MRGDNPEKPDQGQISWRCVFDSTPTFEKQHKSPSSDFTRFTAWFTGGRVDLDGEEPGEDVRVAKSDASVYNKGIFVALRHFAP